MGEGEGVLFLVVGPSGVGKDTLLDAARAELDGAPEFVFARRAITRPAEAGGEAHEAMDEAAFAAAEAAGAFMATWRAHGLAYGIRREMLDALRAGRNVIVNGSRGEIASVAAVWPRLVVLSITAPPEVVESRLRARGREDASAVAARLARAVPISGAPRIIEIANDGAVADGAAHPAPSLFFAGLVPDEPPRPLGRRRAPFVIELPVAAPRGDDCLWPTPYFVAG